MFWEELTHRSKDAEKTWEASTKGVSAIPDALGKELPASPKPLGGFARASGRRRSSLLRKRLKDKATRVLPNSSWIWLSKLSLTCCRYLGRNSSNGQSWPAWELPTWSSGSDAYGALAGLTPPSSSKVCGRPPAHRAHPGPETKPVASWPVPSKVVGQTTTMPGKGIRGTASL